LDFRISQGSVATYYRWGGNFCVVYIDHFLMNHSVKEFWKLIHICQSYYQTSSGLLFLRQCIYGVDFIKVIVFAVIVTGCRCHQQTLAPCIKMTRDSWRVTFRSIR